MIIKLTNACNLACTYCYDFEEIERAQSLKAELAIWAISQAMDICEGRLQVIFHGGEPMLMWNLIEQTVQEGEALAARSGVKLRFVGQTNMTRLNDRIVEFPTKHNISWGISLDGPSIQHNQFQGFCRKVRF